MIVDRLTQIRTSHATRYVARDHLRMMDDIGFLLGRIHAAIEVLDAGPVTVNVSPGPLYDVGLARGSELVQQIALEALLGKPSKVSA